MKNFWDEFTEDFNGGATRTVDTTIKCAQRLYEKYSGYINTIQEKVETVKKTPEDVRKDASKAIKDYANRYREEAAKEPETNIIKTDEIIKMQ